MKILVTGATGYVGSAIAEKLREHGHQVIGSARSEIAAEKLRARGIEVVRADMNSPESFASAARLSDGVIHAAFNEGYDFLKAVEAEQQTIRILINTLADSAKALIYTSGTAVLGDTGDRVFDEETPITLESPGPDDEGNKSLKALGLRLETEREVLQAKGVRGIVIRPPNIYGRSNGKSLFPVLKTAGEKLGAVPYAAGTGDHLWSFVHLDDLTDLYLLALEKGNGGQLFHAGAESGLRTKDISEALSRGAGLRGKTIELEISALGEALSIPPLAPYWASNSQSSSEKAKKILGWHPKHEQLLNEISKGE